VENLSDLSLPTTDPRRLSTAAHQDGKAIVLQLKGVSDMTDQPALSQVLQKAHVHATEMKVSEVKVDLRELKFMNSSCLKQFVTWLTQIRTLPVAERYKVRFTSNPDIRWQRGSLHALSAFAAELVTVE
jgi:hypothetical protein